MSIFAWSSFDTVMSDSDEALRTRALNSNQFAAKYVAKTVTNELELRYRAVEEMAVSPRFQKLLETTLQRSRDDASCAGSWSDPQLSEAMREAAAGPAGRRIRPRATCSSGCRTCCTIRTSRRISPVGSSPTPRGCNWRGRRSTTRWARTSPGARTFTAVTKIIPRAGDRRPTSISRRRICRPCSTAR